MKINPVSLVIMLLFVYPILKGFIVKFSSAQTKQNISSVTSDISFVIAIFLGFTIVKNIFVYQKNRFYISIYSFIPKWLLELISAKPIILYVIITPIFIFILYKLIYMLFFVINSITTYVAVDSIEESLKRKREFSKRVIGAVFEVPRGICYVLISAFILNFFSVFVENEKFLHYVEDSIVYNYLSRQVIIPITDSELAKKLPNIIDNSFKIVIDEETYPTDSDRPKNTIVYYNGVTLEEGVKSNKEIDTFALSLTSEANNNREKAKTIYNWIGKNIDYDYSKAEKILKNDYKVESGAIVTYETRKGICFDYACLYVAICRANKLPVRLITGKGFNGVGWVSHSWNQVFIEEENKWINVDTTFYKGGDYFDNWKFELDHKDSQIEKEWN